MNLGMQLQKLRQQNNITRETLAAELGITVNTMGKWEENITQPNMNMLCRLADYFRVTTDELLGRVRRGTFMVCDNTELVGLVLRNLLEQEGFFCSGLAADGTQLHTCLEKSIPNILFLELNPAREEGLDILKEMKEKYPSVLVIIVTADPTEETRQTAVSYGADAYIVKPFPPKQLLETVDMLLSAT